MTLAFIQVQEVSQRSVYHALDVARPALPSFGEAGTGGVQSEEFHRKRLGYQPVELLELLLGQAQSERRSPFAELMGEVRTGFGRTLNRLPEVFGVSRQTLYNWLDGETPKERHHAKLSELAAAARVFTQTNFKPTATSLDRTIIKGKTLLELIVEGANGGEIAAKLVRIVRHDELALKKVDEILGDRRLPRPEVSDMGTPSFTEDS